MKKFNFKKIFNKGDSRRKRAGQKPLSLQSKGRDWRMLYATFIFLFISAIGFGLHMFYQVASENIEAETTGDLEEAQTLDRDALTEKLLKFERAEAEFNHLLQEPPATIDPSL